MIRKLKYIVTFFCCLFVTQEGQAQNEKTKDLLKKVQQAYENTKQYQIAVTYNMHRGFSGNNITESYQGTMVKNGKFSQFKALNSEIIQFPRIQLTIDHTEKVARYAKTEKGATVPNSPLDVANFLKFYDKTIVTEREGILVCEMVATKVNMQNPYAKVVLHVDKKTYRIEKQELFFTAMIPFVESDGKTRKMDVGRLVILMDFKETEEQAEPTPNDFIVLSGKDDISLTEQYQGYRLINLAH